MSRLARMRRWSVALVVLSGWVGCDASVPRGLDQARVRDCSLSPARQVLDLGTLTVGRSEDRQFEFGPSDPDCLVETVEFLSVSGEVAALQVNGVATPGPVPWSFGPRAVAAFTVTGRQPGTHRVELNWEFAGPGGASVQLWTLEIIATVEEPAAPVVLPEALAFGRACPGDRRTLVLANPLPVPVRIDRIEVGDGFEASWPTEIPPNESRAVEVEFVPSEVGDYSATMQIETRVEGVMRSMELEVEATVAGGTPRSQVFEVQDGMELDLLIVVDPSTLGNQHPQVEAELAAVLDGLLNDPRIIDYRVAVTTSDMNGAAGRFLPLNGAWEDKIITRRSQPHPREHLARLLSEVEVSDEPNLVLDAFYTAFTPPLISRDDNAGFLRHSPAMHGVLAVTDRADESQRSTDLFVNFLWSIKGFCGSCVDYATFGLASGGPGGCLAPDGRTAAAAPRLTRVATLSTGFATSICQPDWGFEFESFPKFREEWLREPTRFVLEADPTPSTLLIEVDGEVYDPEEGSLWLYNPSQREVVFTPRGRPLPGSRVDIDYWTGCRS